MSPSTSPPTATVRTMAEARRLRPWYLAAVLMLSWFVGVQGVTSGCAQVAYLREGNVPAEVGSTGSVTGEEEGGMAQVIAIEANARLRSLSDAQAITFPLSVAKLLLAGFLVVASGMALGGRLGGRSLALQALIANALLALVEYRLTGGMRAAWIEAVVRARDGLPSLTPEQLQLMSPSMLLWGERLRLVVLDLAATALAVLALGSRRSRAYFHAAASVRAQGLGEGS